MTNIKIETDSDVCNALKEELGGYTTVHGREGMAKEGEAMKCNDPDCSCWFLGEPCAASPAPDPVRMALAAISEACPEPRDPSAYLSPFHAQILDAARLARAALRAPPQSVGNPLGSVSREAVIEECAKHLEHEADVATNSLHCGDNSSTIAATHRISRAYHEAAKSIRRMTGNEGWQAIDPLHSTSEK